MTTTAKGQRDKPHAPAPRLLPRATAASAARAARNATNRNVMLPVCQRLSPSRISSPAPSKGKSVTGRYLSKTDAKINHNHENDVTLTTFIDNPLLPQESESFVIENPSNMEEEYVPTCYDAQEINETDHFEIKHNVDIFQDFGRIEEDFENEHVIENITKSRPHTPRSLQSSRPQTPRMPSRPTTPAYPIQRHSTPASQPNTPQRLATPTRPKTPTSPLVTFNRNPTIVATCCSLRPKKECIDKDHDNKTTSDMKQKQFHQLNKELDFKENCIDKDQDIKTAYDTKQKQFLQLKKELDFKQQAVLEVFKSLRDMRERIPRDGVPGNGEYSHRQELMVINVADWSAEEVSQLCRDTVTSSTIDTAAELMNTTVPIDECILAELDTKVSNVPACFADLCLQAISARQEVIDWVKELVEKNDLQKEEGGGECFKRIAHYNAQGLELCDTLRELKAYAEDAVDTITKLSKRACRERSALVTVGESLVREIACLRQDIEARAALVYEMRDIRVENDVTKALDETRRELEEERAARNTTKEKLANTEANLRQTRTRVTKMNRQLCEAEASIASLTSTVKVLEDQSRSREVQLEARARKLKESLKTGEVTSGQLAQQRDALQAEILVLKEQIEKMTSQHKTTIQDLNCQLKDLNKSLEEQQIMTQKEVRLKEAAEAALQENLNALEDLKSKIIELENSRPNPDLPTEREMDLWAELQATKDTLRITEDEVTACKKEKVRFLETLTKIAESENKVGLQQKLAAELLSKEEIVGKMQSQIRELTKNIKLNEQKVIQYEQYVRDLQAHNRAVANCLEAPNGISYQDLQQEIMNLKMGLLEAVHRNEELSEMLVQKEQQLEQQDKTSRAQARVIKVREELINMLKNKETEQSRELAALQQDLEHRMKIVEEVNKQIAAKAEEIQQLFTTLENKQQQIHRLEKIVLALEEQQRRAQAQRTRHEEKIAALEHELAAGGNRRERKFLFF